MLNLAEALEVLNSTKDSEITIGYLEELAKNVSIEDAKANSNAITYLYSGGHMDNNGKWVSVRDTYITPELGNENVRLIDRTYLGQFLDSDEYRNALIRAYVNEGYDLTTASNKATAYTGGTGNSGPWADASKRFASETIGEVKVFLALRKILCKFNNSDKKRYCERLEKQPLNFFYSIQ